jgi:hypothetical protein
MSPGTEFYSCINPADGFGQKLATLAHLGCGRRQLLNDG